MIYTLGAGKVLTVTVNEGRVQVRCEALGESRFTRSALVFGPYLIATEWLIDGEATVTTADYVPGLNSLVMANAGAPDDAAQATLTVNPTGDDNSLIFTARVYGTEGNAISVAYVDPGADDAELAVSVFRQAITVSLATDSGGSITSTAAEVLAAIEADGAANELVTVALDEADTNFSDGSGVVTEMAADVLADGAGTGIGAVVKGGICIDTTNGATYINTGTMAAPVWTASVELADYAATAAIANALSSLHLYGAGAPVDYTDGTPPATGEGTAPKGAIYSDITNGFVYRNSGSQAEPTWTKLGDAA